MTIRKATHIDADQIWEIISEVISKGDTYVFAPDSSKEKMLDYWLAADKHTFVADQNGEILGTFYLKANQPDLGSHIANAGYMVSSRARGQGLGNDMAEFSIIEAKQLGFRAMQFNIVIKTNENAIRLWQKLGFHIVGEIPDAFQHSQFGFVNAYVMYRSLV